MKNIPKNFKIIFPEDMPKETEEVPNDLSNSDLNELYNLFLKFKKMCKFHNGIGLSAIQVGIPLKVFIACIDKKWRFFINCHYTKLKNSSKIKSLEGCLTLPMRQFLVERFEKINIIGKELVVDNNFKIIDINESYEGQNAVVLQHEIDHQNCILISDIGKEMEKKCL